MQYPPNMWRPENKYRSPWLAVSARAPTIVDLVLIEIWIVGARTPSQEAGLSGIPLGIRDPSRDEGAIRKKMSESKLSFARMGTRGNNVSATFGTKIKELVRAAENSPFDRSET